MDIVNLSSGKYDASFLYDKNIFELDLGVLFVKEAGGIFVKPNGSQILYNRDDVYNREGFIVMNKLHEKLLVK